jgi:hypothetical protein
MQDRDGALDETAKKLASEITTILLAPASSITDNNASLNYTDFLWLG